jgi:hypothetical protein
MKAFLSKFGSVVRGVLSGFDRLFFRGTLRNLSYRNGLQHYLWHNHIPYKDFDAHSKTVSKELEEASLRHARELGREIRYLKSSKTSTEEEAKQIAARDDIREGPICVLRRVDPCMSFEIRGNRRAQKLDIVYRERQCMHLYHYQIHPIFGFMHARIQTWFPFHVYVCINGHEWLARQMDQAGLGYQRRDNCFTDVEDLTRAQQLFDQQLQTHWPTLLNDLAATLNPIHAAIFAKYPTHYYWSVAQSEWSTDVLFRSRADLLAIYPRLVRHAITTYGAGDVLRFLGRRIGAQGKVPANFNGDVQSNVHEREEGVRVKHWFNHNSQKLYDKWSVLRPEVTMNNPKDFSVYRPKEGDPEGPKSWRPLRFGVADLYRRAQVCQAANERYLDALAAVQDTTPLRELAEPLCRRVLEPRSTRDQAATEPEHAAQADDAVTIQAPTALATIAETVADTPGVLPTNDEAALPGTTTPPAPPVTTAETVADIPGVLPTSAEAAVPPTTSPPAPPTAAVQEAKQTKRRRLRALNPLSADDSNLLEAVSRHEFLINGLRNRDVRRLLFPTEPGSKAEERRRAAVISRKLRLLRAHSLIRKVPTTHRYMVSGNGRKVITALLAARDANADFLSTNAA